MDHSRKRGYLWPGSDVMLMTVSSAGNVINCHGGV